MADCAKGRLDRIRRFQALPMRGRKIVKGQQFLDQNGYEL